MEEKPVRKGGFEPIPEEVEAAARVAIDCAFKVHTFLGPGVLESIYERCLIYEIRKAGHECEGQVATPLVYDGHEVGEAFYVDILVDGCLILELKTVEKILPVHEAQLLSYLRLTDRRLGLLINFKTDRLKHGIRRLVL